MREATRTTMTTTGDSSPLTYFLAGALLPTLAYVLLFRGKSSGSEAVTFDDDDDDSSDDEFGADMSASPAKTWGMKDAPYKMVLCVNTSLGMGKGKIAAQCCHAALGCYKRARKNCPAAVRAWEFSGCAKIAVKCPSEDELETIMVAAHQRGLPMYFVVDAGRTQIAAGSRTVLGLGPAPVSAFEGVSDHLKLM